VWYQSPANAGWANRGRKSSVIDADNLPSSSLKPSAGRVIRIINNNDHAVQVSFQFIPTTISARGNNVSCFAAKLSILQHLKAP
jgi:hypothetical protein